MPPRSSGHAKPTILIAEDDIAIREDCLRPTLEPLFDIVAEVADGEAAVASVETYKPDVVLLDVSLPVLRGFDAARKILTSHPRTKVIFVSSFKENAYIEEALRMGAGGYVLKSRVASELLNAIQAVLAGDFYRPVFTT